MAGGEELDEAALEVLEALERLEEGRRRLTERLREGWLCLGQARYVLGGPRVSPLQYSSTMAPRLRLHTWQGSGGALQFREVPGGPPEDPETPLGGGDGLRQRRGPPEKEGVPPRPPPPRDPLTWFGVLVPPSLRQAQRSFIQGVSLAVELAGLQAQVTAATARYRELLRQRGTRGDTGTSGDTESLGDSRSHGDTGSYGDAEISEDTKMHG